MKQVGSSILPIVLVLSCAAPTRDSMLAEYLNQTLKIPIDQQPKAIVVITEEGCPTCNRSLADLVRKRTAKASCLFLISAEGRSVNLNGFLDETPNVRHDDGSFKELGIMTGSGVLVLRNKKIDTVFTLQIADLHEHLRNIEQLLDTLE